MGNDILLHDKYAVKQNDFAAAGEVSAKFKKILKQIGIDTSVIRSISIAAYEAEINMVIHSFGGEMSMDVFSDHITVICHDEGPGIKDLDKAMQEGYSTASDVARNMGFGAGMGLPNIRKNASFLDVSSSSAGTIITMRFDI